VSNCLLTHKIQVKDLCTTLQMIEQTDS